MKLIFILSWHKNPHAYIKKPTHPKRVTVWSGFWSTGIIGPVFFENEQGEADTLNGDRYRAMLNEFLFTKIKEGDIGIICFNRTALRANQPKQHLIFFILILKIALSAAELMSFGHLGAPIWHRWAIKCYAEKPKTIAVLKDNIREAIGEIQLHTIDNVLKNWTDHVGYCMANRFSIINRKDCTFI